MRSVRPIRTLMAQKVYATLDADNRAHPRRSARPGWRSAWSRRSRRIVVLYFGRGHSLNTRPGP